MTYKAVWNSHMSKILGHRRDIFYPFYFLWATIFESAGTVHLMLLCYFGDAIRWAVSTLNRSLNSKSPRYSLAVPQIIRDFTPKYSKRFLISRGGAGGWFLLILYCIFGRFTESLKIRESPIWHQFCFKNWIISFDWAFIDKVRLENLTNSDTNGIKWSFI